MNTITIYTLYQYLQKSLHINSSFITSLLTEAQKKFNTFQRKKHHTILYPSRSTTILSAESFFSNPTKILQQSGNITTKKIINDNYASTETIKVHSHSVPVCPSYVAPREPIVLCHGLFGFDIRGPESIPALQVHYWDGVEDTLAKLGAKVIVTKVPQAGSIWERSLALHNILKSILVGKKVNFVAHSMVTIMT
ncbi:hypothetical protein RMATCC62417_09487 [Rhizopus microsporus]|nr:hypothetical protein RMATCC62417_09487 [Rhizopus microsporus]CEI92902.1 hypothetical protein RMCBS344292_07149 [Rhizopus microsporus]